MNKIVFLLGCRKNVLNCYFKNLNYFIKYYFFLNHYDALYTFGANTNLDPRLTPGGNGQQLNIKATEVNALIAFIKTLTGTTVYTDPKWSSPFK
jgi:cytochrome c peroxidase